MPFVATTADGEVIAPPQADRDAEYKCPECNDTITVRRGHERDGHAVARHFWHPNGRNGCEGESDEHRRMKSIAFWKAEQRWPSASVGYEIAVDDRRADVLVEFDGVDERLGEGLAIECQYRNEGKDVEAVTNDFLEAGYSVLWLEADHFDGMDVDLEAGDWRLWWPRQVPTEDVWGRGIENIHEGYHGIIHWLRDTKPTEVELKIPTFPDLVYEKIYYMWHDEYYANRPEVHRPNTPPLEPREADQIEWEVACTSCGKRIERSNKWGGKPEPLKLWCNECGSVRLFVPRRRVEETWQAWFTGI